jgi:hypothetical protein
MRAAVSIQLGHAVWMAFGAIYMAQWTLDDLDPIFLVAGSVWLILRAGLGPVLLLSGYHLLGLAVNLWKFHEADAFALEGRALAVHILFRVAALAAMGFGLLKLRRKAAPPEAPPAAAE